MLAPTNPPLSPPPATPHLSPPPPFDDDDPELYQVVSLFFVGAALVGLALAWACARESAEAALGPDCALPPEEGEVVATEHHDA